MSLDLKQSLKLTQNLLMTPQLQQAIKLLQLSRIELEEFVANQIIENPTLEDTKQEKNTELLLNENSNEIAENNFDEQRVEFEGFRNSADVLSGQKTSRKQAINYIESENFSESNIIKSDSLQDYLLSQVGEIQFEKKEFEIAEKLIGNITDHGYLDLDLQKFCEDENVEFDLVEGVLDTIQRLDPPGIGARNLEECLNIQLRESGLKNGIVEKIVNNHLKDLETKNYSQISKKLGIDLQTVYENVATIVGLNPVPGKIFGHNDAQIIIPDVYVFKISNKWVVSLNEDNIPDLHISDYYQKMSNSIQRGSDKTYLQEKIKSANWLIKSIQQRQRTILRVSECIVEKQFDFLEGGIRYLKPMVLRDVAEAIEMHESTISRVTSGKYMHTPRGIFELKFFFSSSVKSDEDDVSSSFVKEIIKEIISTENEKKPFSDQKIVEFLSEKGVHMARRTVAKYREQIGILPSSKRKKYF